MKLVVTAITETHIRMRYADSHDSAKATQWLEFQLPLAGLDVAVNSTAKIPLGDPELARLVEVHLAALRAARDVIGGETQRYSRLRDHND